MKTRIESNTPKPVQGFYTITEVAALAGCSGSNVHYDIRLGRLKATKTDGRRILIAQGDASTYLEQRQKNRR